MTDENSHPSALIVEPRLAELGVDTVAPAVISTSYFLSPVEMATGVASMQSLDASVIARTATHCVLP